MEAAKLKSLLECPVCLAVPRTKIFNCINSHRICEFCYNKMAEDNGGVVHCPQGGCGYDKPPRRARDCEALVENSDLELSCQRPGCNVEMKRKRIVEHEARCIFRTVPCPNTCCKQMILFRNIDSHVAEIHSVKVKKSSKIRPYFNRKLLDDTLLSSDWALSSYIEGEVEFYPQFVKRKGLWYFWVKIKDGSKEASKWKFVVKLRSVENQFSLEYSGLVHPVDMFIGEILVSGQYLLLDKYVIDKLKESLSSEVYGFTSVLDIPFTVTKRFETIIL